MKTRTTIFSGAALAALLALGTGAALAINPGDTAGKTQDEIRATLEADGYEVRKIETDDGQLEAYAVKDGKRYEIYVDPADGKVTRIKEDD